MSSAYFTVNRKSVSSELSRLISEAPKIAPSIVHYDKEKNYGTVTDESLDAQAVLRWELEAVSILQHLSKSGSPVFQKLYTQCLNVREEAQKFHSRSILVHQLMQLLISATQLSVNFSTIPAIWNWLRNPKNLAVLTALGSGVAYLINLATKPEHPQVPTPAQPAVVVSPQIHIENKPSNVVNISPQSQFVGAQTANAAAAETSPPQARVAPASVPLRFPIRRNAGFGIPVDFIPGFSVTVASVFGSGGRLEVELESELWSGAKRGFAVGASPIDITVKGGVYRLSVESADRNSALIVLDHAKP